MEEKFFPNLKARVSFQMNNNPDYLIWRTKKDRLQNISYCLTVPGFTLLIISGAIFFLGTPGSRSGYSVIGILISAIIIFIGICFQDSSVAMGAKHYTER